MRWLSMYLQQVFCKHKLVTEETFCTKSDPSIGSTREGPKISILCDRCGYHKSFWKF
jgi:hypothetical protein